MFLFLYGFLINFEIISIRILIVITIYILSLNPNLAIILQRKRFAVSVIVSFADCKP